MNMVDYVMDLTGRNSRSLMFLIEIWGKHKNITTKDSFDKRVLIKYTDRSFEYIFYYIQKQSEIFTEKEM